MRLKVVGRNFTLGALNHPEKQTNEQTDRVKNKTKQNKIKEQQQQRKQI